MFNPFGIGPINHYITTFPPAAPPSTSTSVRIPTSASIPTTTSTSVPSSTSTSTSVSTSTSLYVPSSTSTSTSPSPSIPIPTLPIITQADIDNLRQRITDIETARIEEVTTTQTMRTQLNELLTASAETRQIRADLTNLQTQTNAQINAINNDLKALDDTSPTLIEFKQHKLESSKRIDGILYRIGQLNNGLDTARSAGIKVFTNLTNDITELRNLVNVLTNQVNIIDPRYATQEAVTSSIDRLDNTIRNITQQLIEYQNMTNTLLDRGEREQLVNPNNFRTNLDTLIGQANQLRISLEPVVRTSTSNKYLYGGAMPGESDGEDEDFADANENQDVFLESEPSNEQDYKINRRDILRNLTTDLVNEITAARNDNTNQTQSQYDFIEKYFKFRLDLLENMKELDSSNNDSIVLLDNQIKNNTFQIESLNKKMVEHQDKLQLIQTQYLEINNLHEEQKRLMLEGINMLKARESKINKIDNIEAQVNDLLSTRVETKQLNSELIKLRDQYIGERDNVKDMIDSFNTNFNTKKDELTSIVKIATDLKQSNNDMISAFITDINNQFTEHKLDITTKLNTLEKKPQDVVPRTPPSNTNDLKIVLRAQQKICTQEIEELNKKQQSDIRDLDIALFTRYSEELRKVINYNMSGESSNFIKFLIDYYDNKFSLLNYIKTFEDELRESILEKFNKINNFMAQNQQMVGIIEEAKQRIATFKETQQSHTNKLSELDATITQLTQEQSRIQNLYNEEKRLMEEFKNKMEKDNRIQHNSTIQKVTELTDKLHEEHLVLQQTIKANNKKLEDMEPKIQKILEDNNSINDINIKIVDLFKQNGIMTKEFIDLKNSNTDQQAENSALKKKLEEFTQKLSQISSKEELYKYIQENIKKLFDETYALQYVELARKLDDIKLQIADLDGIKKDIIINTIELKELRQNMTEGFDIAVEDAVLQAVANAKENTQSALNTFRLNELTQILDTFLQTDITNKIAAMIAKKLDKNPTTESMATQVELKKLQEELKNLQEKFTILTDEQIRQGKLILSNANIKSIVDEYIAKSETLVNKFISNSQTQELIKKEINKIRDTFITTLEDTINQKLVKMETDLKGISLEHANKLSSNYAQSQTNITQIIDDKIAAYKNTIDELNKIRDTTYEKKQATLQSQFDRNNTDIRRMINDGITNYKKQIDELNTLKTQIQTDNAAQLSVLSNNITTQMKLYHKTIDDLIKQVPRPEYDYSNTQMALKAIQDKFNTLEIIYESRKKRFDDENVSSNPGTSGLSADSIKSSVDKYIEESNTLVNNFLSNPHTQQVIKIQLAEMHDEFITKVQIEVNTKIDEMELKLNRISNEHIQKLTKVNNTTNEEHLRNITLLINANNAKMDALETKTDKVIQEASGINIRKDTLTNSIEAATNKFDSNINILKDGYIQQLGSITREITAQYSQKQNELEEKYAKKIDQYIEELQNLRKTIVKLQKETNEGNVILVNNYDQTNESVINISRELADLKKTLKPIIDGYNDVLAQTKTFGESEL